MIKFHTCIVRKCGCQGLIIECMEDIVSDDEVVKSVFVICDDDTMAIILHVEQVIDDFNIGFEMRP